VRVISAHESVSILLHTHSDFSFSAFAILSAYVVPPPLLYKGPQLRLQFFAALNSDFTLSSLNNIDKFDAERKGVSYCAYWVS
jgi:hypothetical protein